MAVAHDWFAPFGEVTREPHAKWGLESLLAGYCFTSENLRFDTPCKKRKGQSALQSIVAKRFGCNKWAHTQSLGRT